MLRFVVTPTKLLKNKRSLSGKYFSLIPCENCENEGAKFEVRAYFSNLASFSHLDFIISFEGHPVNHDDFTGVRSPSAQYFFCSEECVNLWILAE